MRFVLRFFFDAGAGICFWAGNDAANERFGYAVDAADLPLTEETRAAVDALIVRFDESVDWNDPMSAGPWSRDEELEFAAAARDVLARVRHELGENFDVRDESRLG